MFDVHVLETHKLISYYLKQCCWTGAGTARSRIIFPGGEHTDTKQKSILFSTVNTRTHWNKEATDEWLSAGFYQLLDEEFIGRNTLLERDREIP
jgi:hypothetical protein